MMRRAFVVGPTVPAAEEWAKQHPAVLGGFDVVEFTSPRSVKLGRGRGRGLVADAIYLLPGVEATREIREWALPMLVSVGGVVFEGAF